jgi:hypothetical protein
MHFLFNLFRIKGLYVFRALLDHLQKALHKRHFVYCVRACCVSWNSTQVHSTNKTQAKYQSSVCVAPPEDEQVMLEKCRGP